MNGFEPDLNFVNLPLSHDEGDASADFSCPRSLDMRDLVLKTENQGQTSACAAYTATSWIESVMWRKTGKPVHYDAMKLYDYAKAHSVNPECPGLSLPDVMISMVELGMCPGFTEDDIMYIFTPDELKRAIHRYGTCLLGLEITNRWNSHVGRLVLKDCGGSPIGGHAVICTGYNDVGVLIQNSWGTRWGKYGFACLTWDVFNCEFMVGSYIRNCLNDLENE